MTFRYGLATIHANEAQIDAISKIFTGVHCEYFSMKEDHAIKSLVHSNVLVISKSGHLSIRSDLHKNSGEICAYVSYYECADTADGSAQNEKESGDLAEEHVVQAFIVQTLKKLKSCTAAHLQYQIDDRFRGISVEKSSEYIKHLTEKLYIRYDSKNDIYQYIP